MAEAGFPPGTVNLVTGAGGEVGDAIVENPDVRSSRSPARRPPGGTSPSRPAASSSGSASSSAARTRSSSSPTRTSTSRPTGSSGPRSGRPASAARPRAASSSSGRSSSRCSSDSSVAPRTLRLGSGLDESVDVGPLINRGAVDKVAGYVEIGRTEGELVIGGAAASDGDLANGHFFAPTIFREVAPDGPDRPGGDLRAGPVDHPGRRLRRPR